MNSALEDALIDLLVQRTAAAITAAAIVDWATDVLAAGEDTPTLVILAGLPRDSSVFEASPLLDITLAELQIVVPASGDLSRAFVGVTSRALLAGRLTSDEALDCIHKHAVDPLGHPPDLASWCYVWEGIGPTDFRELSRADIDVEARKLARAWAGRAGLSGPEPSSQCGGVQSQL